MVQNPSPKPGKTENPKAKRLSLTEYQTLKEKNPKKLRPPSMPGAVKLCIALPLILLLLLLCFGLLYIPHLPSTPNPEDQEENQVQP